MDIKEFTGIIKNSIDKEGLFPHIGYGITKDDKVDMFALMTELSALPQVRKFIQQYKEFAFTVDRCADEFQREQQNLKFADFITVFHYKNGTWNFGILEYGDNHIDESINWENEFWCNQMKKEINHYFSHGECQGG